MALDLKFGKIMISKNLNNVQVISIIMVSSKTLKFILYYHDYFKIRRLHAVVNFLILNFNFKFIYVIILIYFVFVFH